MIIKTLLFLIIFSHSAYAEEKKATSKMVVSSVEENEDLRKLLKIPGVQKIYDQCKALNKSLKDMPACIWEDVAKDQNLKEMVLAAYKETITYKDANNKNIKDLTANQTNIRMNFSAEQNKGYEKLAEIIGKKLHESLYGEKPDPEKLVAIDHTKFHDLYKTELSKAIVDSMTNYCLKTDLSTPFENMNSISSCEDEQCLNVKPGAELVECKKAAKGKCLNLSFSTAPSTNMETNLKAMNEGTINESMVTACMSSIPANCSKNEGDNPPSAAKKEACVVVENLKAIRKNLVLNEKLLKVYEETAGVNNPTNIAMDKITRVSGEKDDTMKTITVTSADVEKAYREQDEILKREALDCEKNPQLANCSKFLDTNKDEKEKAVIEYGLRQFAQGDEIQTNLDSKNKNVFKEYLERLGYSKEKIEELLADENSLKKVKDLIEQKFKSQKESIIAELAERVDKTTTAKNGSSTEEDSNKYKQIGVELANKTETLKNMVRFNNIASSYLTIKDKDEGRNPSSAGKVKANTASLKEELNADKNNPNNKKVSDNKKDILADPKGSGNAFLEVQDLNEILGF